MSRAGSHARSRRDTAGLTLLEVLAAAMIFAIVMTVLIGTSTEAVQRAGLTKRRLEANMWADELVADLELQMRARERPVFEDELVEDPFVARTTESNPIQASSTPSGVSAPGGAGSAQIAAFFPPIAQHTWQYDIEIEWPEAGNPQKIERTTYFFDWTAATEQFPDFFPTDSGAAGDAGSDSDQSGNAPQLPPGVSGRDE